MYGEVHIELLANRRTPEKPSGKEEECARISLIYGHFEIQLISQNVIFFQTFNTKIYFILNCVLSIETYLSCLLLMGLPTKTRLWRMTQSVLKRSIPSNLQCSLDACGQIILALSQSIYHDSSSKGLTVNSC